MKSLSKTISRLLAIIQRFYLQICKLKRFWMNCDILLPFSHAVGEWEKDGRACKRRQSRESSNRFDPRHDWPHWLDCHDGNSRPQKKLRPGFSRVEADRTKIGQADAVTFAVRSRQVSPHCFSSRLSKYCPHS
jgi:hypothetical protein